MKNSCAVVDWRFSSRAQGGVEVLESRDKGAKGGGQWEAIYCYGYAALGVATAVNSSVITIMLIMDSRQDISHCVEVRMRLFSFHS
jgi:hypothetical protein